MKEFFWKFFGWRKLEIKFEKEKYNEVEHKLKISAWVYKTDLERMQDNFRIMAEDLQKNGWKLI